VDYDEYILRALKAVPELRGEIAHLAHVRSLNFNQVTYPQLLESLKSGQPLQLTGQSEGKSDFGEYVEIYKITTKNGAFYLATFYDSNALEQDPQIIDLIPIKP